MSDIDLAIANHPLFRDLLDDEFMCRVCGIEGPSFEEWADCVQHEYDEHGIEPHPWDANSITRAES